MELTFQDGEKQAEMSIKALIDSVENNKIIINLDKLREEGYVITKDYIEGFVSKLNKKSRKDSIDELNRHKFISIKNNIDIIGKISIIESGSNFIFGFDYTESYKANKAEQDETLRLKKEREAELYKAEQDETLRLKKEREAELYKAEQDETLRLKKEREAELYKAEQDRLSEVYRLRVLKFKNTSLILCIFLGWLGIHRFYLKYYWTGMFYFIIGTICFSLFISNNHNYYPILIVLGLSLIESLMIAVDSLKVKN